MALHPSLPPVEPQPNEEEESLYDETVAESFPASDPPPGVIKLGPRQRRPLPPR